MNCVIILRLSEGSAVATYSPKILLAVVIHLEWPIAPRLSNAMDSSQIPVVMDVYK